MKVSVISVLIALFAFPLVSSQYEDYPREKGEVKRSKKSEWYWDSSTTTTSPSTTTIAQSSTTTTTQVPTTTNGVSEHSSTNITDIRPANVTSGRSSKAMNFDIFGGGSGIREGRILNDDPGNRKINLQGFIPIISFSDRGDKTDSPLSKSPQRAKEEELYYDGPYPPQPIEDEEKESQKLKNYYAPNAYSPATTESNQYYQDGIEYGTRILDLQPATNHKQRDFYLPSSPSTPDTIKNSQYNIGDYLKKKNVRFVDAIDYHNRQPKQHQQNPYTLDNTRAESQGGHFSVPSKPEDTQYAQAVAYPSNADNNKHDYRALKDTTGKQLRPGVKQFDAYELAGGYGFANENTLGDEDKCICVPFYLCRNGYLVNGRSQGPVEPIDERSARKVTRRSAGNETQETREPSSDIPPYTADIMSRMVGLSNVAHSCGLLRRCCKVLPAASGPSGLLPFSPDNYPISHPVDLSQLPPGLLPPELQNQHQFQRPQIHQEQPHSFIVHEDRYPQPSPHQEHVIVVPQEIRPPQRRPKPVAPRPVYPPHPAPVRPLPPHVRPHPPHTSPKPVRPIPIYPHPKPVHRPVHEQPQSHYPPQPVYPQPQPQPSYQPEYSHPKPQLHQGQCGARNGLGVHGRVNNLQYHDDASEFGEYPWQVAILLKVGPGNNLFVCGGTLVSSLWVATAAHCLKKHQADELKVRLGDWDVHRDDEFYPYVEKFVTEVVPHPEFYPGNLQNDLALLRLDSHVDPSLPHISPACLPEPHETFDNQRCWVTGWGKNAFGEQGEYQSVLKEVDVPMVGHRDCEHRLRQTRLGPHYQLHPGFVCAGGEPGKDACTGDGGSPLICEVHGTWKVAGLVSWGIGCGQPGVPGIYVNIAKYRTWIDTIVNRYG